MYITSNYYTIPSISMKYNLHKIDFEHLTSRYDRRIFEVNNIHLLKYIYTQTHWKNRFQYALDNQEVNPKVYKYFLKNNTISNESRYVYPTKGNKLIHFKNIILSESLYARCNFLKLIDVERRCEFSGYGDTYGYYDIAQIKYSRLKKGMENNYKVILASFVYHHNKSKFGKVYKLICNNKKYQKCFSRVASYYGKLDHVKFIVENKFKVDRSCVNYSVKRNNMEIYDYLRDNGF